MQVTSFKDTVVGKSAAEYGARYRNHVLEIYRIYVEMADRISARRPSANAYFLSVNTVIVGFLGHLALSDHSSAVAVSRVPIAVAGMVICYLWYRIIRSYRDLNSAKFRVIHEIEARLPLRPYDAEWDAVGRGENPGLYLPFTHIEVVIPWVFAGVHALAVLGAIPWAEFMQFSGSG